MEKIDEINNRLNELEVGSEEVLVWKALKKNAINLEMKLIVEDNLFIRNYDMITAEIVKCKDEMRELEESSEAVIVYKELVAEKERLITQKIVYG